MAEHEVGGRHEAHQRIVKRLEDQARDVKRLTAGLDDVVLARRVVEGKWSLKELAGHLWRVQQVFEGRLQAMLEADNPTFQSWNPDNDPVFDQMLKQGSAEVVAGFLAARAAFVARLSSLSPADWHRPGRHPDFPNYDVHFLLEYLAHHEAHHLYQMYVRRSGLGKIPHA
ncbi:MAG TPA: DinB family protein [Vicinamibacteria bacterium]